MKSVLSWVLTAALLTTIGAVSQVAADEAKVGPATVDVRILAINDFHGNLEPPPGGIRIADATAFALCMENKLPLIVFGVDHEGTILRVVQGEKIGTLVTAE